MTDRPLSSVWRPIRSGLLVLLAICALALVVGTAYADEPRVKIQATSNVSMAAGDTVGSALYEEHRRPSMLDLAHISVSLEDASQPEHARTSTIDKLSLTSSARIGLGRP